jgi:hypothetical protein
MLDFDPKDFPNPKKFTSAWVVLIEAPVLRSQCYKTFFFIVDEVAK